MKIEVCHIGDTREKWIQTGEDFYLNKCKRFTKIETHYIKSGKHRAPERALAEEQEKLLSYLDKAPRAYLVLLDERGEMFDSPGFANFLDNRLMHHGGALRFVTGGPFGVSQKVREQCDAIVSFSPMVFTHEMIRVILLEQLYRSFSILRGESYHHI